jgi:hypothetical protein
MKRQCMYCGTPIYESMGYVIPRDILPFLEAFFEGRKHKGPQPRELCHKYSCNDKWKEELYNETGNPDFLKKLY